MYRSSVAILLKTKKSAMENNIHTVKKLYWRSHISENKKPKPPRGICGVAGDCSHVAGVLRFPFSMSGHSGNRSCVIRSASAVYVRGITGCRGLSAGSVMGIVVVLEE